MDFARGATSAKTSRPLVFGILKRCKKKAPNCFEALCGLDGTRTRDLRRDRPAF